MQFAAADCNFAIFEDFMKKTICTILAVIMIVGCFFAFTACNDDAYGKELIENGSFDNGSSGWYIAKAIDNSKDGTTIKKIDDADNAYLVLNNGSTVGNYVRLYQRVAVRKNGIYKVTARIRNDSLKIGSDDTYQGGGIEITENGARIIASGIEVSENWTTYTAYVKPTNTNEITVAMTLGANGEKTIGQACFDDVSVQRVRAKDVSGEIVKIKKPHEKEYPLSTKTGNVYIIMLAIATAAIIAGAYVAYRYLLNREDKPLLKKSWMTAGALAFIALLIRFILAGVLFDQSGTAALRATLWDIAGQDIGSAGLKYTQYAPLQLYYMWIVGKITLGNYSLSTLNVLLQLVPIILEGATVVMIYYFAKKYASDAISALLALVYAVLPVMFTLSGGYDVEVPVLVFLLFVTFYALTEKDFVMLLIGSLLTCLWSPIGIYVLPFIVAYEVYIMAKTKDKNTIITICVGWFVSFWLFLLISAGAVASMFKAGHIVYIFKNYYLNMFNKQVCVSNAFNLYALFGLNGSSVNNTAFWLNIVFSVILIVYTVSLYFKNFNRAELVLIAGFFLTAMSVFSLNMNEATLAIGLILLLMYVAVSGEERLFWVFGILAFMSFVNVATIMNFSGFLGTTFKTTYFNKGDAGYIIANIIACITVLYYGWVVYDITTNDKRVFIQPLKIKEKKEI